ncbi:BQ2448_1980 [Microbotryum intermedium]|uniref:BQ2448_1980 protein n=1 Tax=Microbotryum intermedium TaxID=269621 RepID=A0A238F4S9_9BASI|nr:BQ2448_1980 [Microbotryum intermedium]
MDKEDPHSSLSAMTAKLSSRLPNWLRRSSSTDSTPASTDGQSIKTGIKHSCSLDETEQTNPLDNHPTLEKNAGRTLSRTESGTLRPLQENNAFLDAADLDPEFLDKNGKERPIETAQDFATRLVSLEDDPSLQVHTVRMWTIGIALTVFGGVMGEILKFRPQTLDVSALFFMGVAWHKALPKAEKGRFWAILNPGPFNIKEHVCITVMAGADNISQKDSLAIMTLIASQFCGYGLAGLFRSVVVCPTYAVWPSLIPTVALVDTLQALTLRNTHSRDHDLSVQKHRYKVFWIVLGTAFAWEWFPQVIAPTLTGISVFCTTRLELMSPFLADASLSPSLANRTNTNFTRLFGGTTGAEGLGLFSISFDWLSITSVPLFQPWGTTVSQGAGVVLAAVVSIAGYYGNVWNTRQLPMLGSTLFYGNGSLYNQSLILDQDHQLNKTALAIQGLPSFTWTRAVYNIGTNLSITASIVHVLLWYHPRIIEAWTKWRGKLQDDAHYLKMQAYPECPTWWYVATVGISFILALIPLYLSNTGMPWWALVIAFLFAAAYLPGFGNTGGALTQMLGAELVPHNARANLYFRLYSSHSVAQGAVMTKTLKYTKIPPRVMFLVQFFGTFVGSIAQYGIMHWIVTKHFATLLTVEGTSQWTGSSVQAFNAQAVTWGALGKEMYGRGNKYFIVPMALVIGMFVPIPLWVAHRYYPKFHLNRVITPALCSAIGLLSSGITSSMMSYFMVAIFSQFYQRNRHPTFFRKYNYLVAAALDGGTQLMVFVATFSINGGGGVVRQFPYWALKPRGHHDYCAMLPKPGMQ